jgi:uncharacterized protein YbjT (DUF2867 family)
MGSLNQKERIMKVLVTGGTGNAGSEAVKALLHRGLSVRVLSRNKEAKLPAGAELTTGDLLSPESVRSALKNVDKLCLIVGNVADELTQALLTVALARRANIRHLVYLSVYRAERFPEAPHFIAKNTVETSLKALEIPSTILRPGYFFQNDAQLKPMLTGPGIYPTPIGKIGVGAIDIRDIADAAAVSLATDEHTGKTYNLIGSAPLTGPRAAAIWSDALGRPIQYPDPQLDVFEKQLSQMLPAWLALDLRLMFDAYLQGRLAPTEGDADAASLTELIGHTPRRYEDFVHETVAGWSK